MKRSVSLLLAALAASSAHGAIINSSIKRVIDLTKHVVRVQTDFQFADADAATSEYVFALAKPLSNRLAQVSAKCGKHTTCEVVKLDSSASPLVDSYAVVFAQPIAAGDVGHIKLNAYFTRVLTPFPTEIAQADEQLVVYEDAHVVPSPYVTESQTTKVKLPSGRVESYTDASPVTLKGSTLTYGPYTQVAPFTAVQPTSLRVHFKSHAPFLTLTSLVKEIEVSMWGRVSVEEVYDLLHTGAKLKGGFSRFEYTMKGAKGASFYEMQAHLPKDAVNVYYRDQIGNVSTSRLRKTDTRQELEFKPRFPIFGGWKSQWYLGYSVPTHSVLARSGGSSKFKLEMDFSTSIEEAAVDELTVKVILPEGATNVQLNLPFDVDSQTRTSRQTYLDTPVFGRPVLVIKKSNVIAQHNVPFEVTFEFQPTFMLHEPLLLVGGFLAFFVFCMVLFRLDVSLVHHKHAKPVKNKTE